MGRTKGSVYQFDRGQAERMAEYGRAAQLMGMTFDQAAARASMELGVPVSGSSISRALKGSIAALRGAESHEPKTHATLFEYATDDALQGITERLDDIISIMKGARA